MDMKDVAHYVNSSFFRRKIHRVTSSGTEHKFLPVVLDATGKLDASLYDSADIGAILSAATAKTTPVDADTLPLNDSAASNALKKVTWANIKATLLNTLATGATAKTSLVDADHVVMIDSAASNVQKKITWANVKAAVKTYTDTLYVALTGDQTVAGVKTFRDGNPPVIAERTISFDAGLYTALRVRVTTTNAAAALGPAMVFDLVDNSGATVNILGLIAAEREGADNTGALILSTSAAGTTTERMRISSAGDVSIRAGGSTGTEARLGGILYQSVTTVGNVGGGEDNLMTFSVPAGTLTAAGDSLWFEALFVLANNANSKTVRMYFGSTVLAALGGTGASNHVQFRGRIWRVNGTAQRASAYYVDTISGATYHTFSAPAETLSNAITIKGTGSATADDDIQMAAFTVGYDPVNT